ncbi:heparinase II/III family protein [Vibrio cyclitrophicus]
MITKRGLVSHSFLRFEGDVQSVFPPLKINGIIERIGKENIIDVVEKQASGLYYIFDYEPYKPVHLSDLWFRDLYSSYRWNRDHYFRDTKLRPKKLVDIKVPWEASRLYHLSNYAFGYEITNKKHYRDLGLSYLMDFIECNPPNIGINWFYSMEVSIRLINIILFVDVISNKGDKVPEKVDNYILLSINHILNNLEWRGGVRNNHYYISLFGLLFGCKRFASSKEYQRIYDFALKEIVLETSFHIMDDGGGAELSTGYHKLNLEAIYLFEQVVGKVIYSDIIFQKKFYFENLMIPIELKKRKLASNQVTEFYSKVDLARGFYASIVNDSSEHPQIGDNDSGCILKQHPYKNNGYGWSRLCYFLTRYQADEQHHINEFNHISFYDQSSSFKLLAKGIEIKGLLSAKSYDNFGLHVIRSDNFLFTVKDLPGAAIPGHSHDDYMSITLCIGDRWLYRDNGTFSYNKERDEYFEGKRHVNHNVRVIDGDITGRLSLSYSDSGHFVVMYRDIAIFILAKDDKGFSIYCSDRISVEKKPYFPDYYINKVDCKL